MPSIHKINLIPADIIEERMRWQRIRRWSIFIICQTLCFCLLGISFYGYLKKLEGKATTLRSRDLKTKRTESELVSSYKSVKDLLTKRDDLLHLTEKHCLCPVLLNLAQDMNPKTSLTRLWIEKGKANYNNKMEAYYEIKLWGTSQSYQNLSNFLLYLQKNKSFQDIKLLKSDVDEKSFIYFEISLTYL